VALVPLFFAQLEILAQAGLKLVKMEDALTLAVEEIVV